MGFIKDLSLKDFEYQYSCSWYISRFVIKWSINIQGSFIINMKDSIWNRKRINKANLNKNNTMTLIKQYCLSGQQLVVYPEEEWSYECMLLECGSAYVAYSDFFQTTLHLNLQVGTNKRTWHNKSMFFFYKSWSESFL